jgi:DNA-binding GntR family transcriptional regulator
MPADDRRLSLPSRVVDLVHDHLRLDVLEGRLRPGDQLAVPRIARELGVSRGSAREAVLQLVGEGLAQEHPRRGVVVAAIGRAEAQGIHQAREALEGYAARLCAQVGDPGLLPLLRDVLDEQEQAITRDDGAGYSRTDGRFHSLIAEHCGNAELRTLIERLRDRMRIALVRVADIPAHRSRGHGELLDVAAAIEVQDRVEAEAAMRRHIGRTSSLLDDV